MRTPAQPSDTGPSLPWSVRWVLAAISPLLGVVVTMAIATGGTTALTKLCPSGQLISGMCIAAWFQPAEIAVMSAGFGIGAVLFVVLPALIAPGRTRTVALVAFGAGLLLLVAMGLSFIPVPSVVATVTGALATIGMWRRPERAG